jgi:hypothetical protein
MVKEMTMLSLEVVVLHLEDELPEKVFEQEKEAEQQ